MASHSSSRAAGLCGVVAVAAAPDTAAPTAVQAIQLLSFTENVETDIVGQHYLTMFTIIIIFPARLQYSINELRH